MFVLMSVHHPKPEHRDDVIASMHRFGAAMEGKPGLVGVHTLADARTERLVGLALFQSKEAADALLPAARAAVAEDDFATWEAADIDGFALSPALIN